MDTIKQTFTQGPIADLISELVVDLFPQVHKIENAPMSTKDHYGAYMTILAGCKGDGMDRMQLLVIGAALVKAGANAEGVKSALKLVG